MGNEAAAAHPLRVRASYVARLDERLRRAGPVDLEDQLWPEAPALCSLEVRNQERLEPGWFRRWTCFFGPRNSQKVQPGIVPQGGHGPPVGQSLAT